MTENTSWLDAPIRTAPADDSNWLETGYSFHMPYDTVRFLCMKGSDRVWACDGNYVACRPTAFHEHTRNRHAGFLASGHYKHLGTFDDVQVFELLPESPFRRDNTTYIPGVNLHSDMRACAISACSGDWVLHVDILDEIAKNIKGNFHPAAATEMWNDTLSHIQQLIDMRRGPNAAMCGAQLSLVRQRRGLGKGRVIQMPPRRNVIR